MMSWLNCQNIINIVLILVILILTGTIVYNRFFKKKKEDMEDGKQITEVDRQRFKDANPTLYKSPTCGHCRTLIELLDKNKVTDLVEIVDINTPEGKARFAALGEHGVPVLESKTNGKRFVGSTNDMKKIIEKISKS